MTTLIQRIASTVAIAATAIVISFNVPRAHAADGTWVQDQSGLWSSPAFWNPGVADGATSTAFFVFNITGDRTVTLDTPRTIGQLKFQDTTPSNNWILTGANTLTLDNGASHPIINVVNQTTTISAILGGTNGVTITGGSGSTSATLNLGGANTYSGVTTINSASTGATSVFNIDAQTSNAFGTSSINYNPGTGNEARILLDSGVTLNNNFTLSSVRPAQGQGALQTNQTQNIGGGAGAITATINGTITKTGASNQGADFAGPNVANDATDFLILNGPIIVTGLPTQTKGTSQNGIQIRLGNVRMADTTGTSSTFVVNPRDGILQVGANNGIATNAYVDIGGNVGNPGGIGRASLDLNGFNQTLVGVSNYVSQTAGNTQANNEFITNSSISSAATLTLVPRDPTIPANANQANLVYTANPNGTSAATAFISDASAAFPLNIVVNGAANGIQYLATPNGSQRGTVTLTSGILAVSSLANGGSNSSIGASTNAASNLVFGGGTLRYTNTALDLNGATVNLANSTTPSTDRNFTINNGTTGTIDVAASGTTLTWSGGSANTTGKLIKAGSGTLILSGTNLHTGGTDVNAGTLNLAGSLSTGTVNVNTGAILNGTGTIGGTLSVNSGGTVAPGNSVGTLIVGGLTLNNGSISNFEFGGGNDMITVNNAGGLTLVNGASMNLYQVGTINPFSTNGPYTLFNINGGFTGAASNITIANPVAGKFYNLTSTALAINLTIGDATTSEWNNGGATGLWDTGGNWTGGEPNAVGTSAKFGTLAPGGTVTLSEPETVSGLIFDNSGNSYTLSGASGSLVLNNGGAAGAITVNNGSHTIDVPMSTAKTISASFSNSSALTISKPISGGAPLQVSGAGTLTLTANNSYSSTTLSAATLNIGTNGGSDTSGTLGTGNLTMSGGATLNFNRTDAGGYTFGGGITGSGVGAGAVFQLGSGKTTVSGAISNVTTLNVPAGTLVASSTISQTGGLYVTGLTGGVSDPTVQGTGSLTANGAISGIGALFVNTMGTVNLNAANSYSPGNATTAGTTINGGTVNLGAAGALPTNTSLAVNGGRLNLNGNNISLVNTLDSTTSTGIIANDGPGNSTSTITFSAPAANYNFYAAINDGTNGGKVAVASTINNTASGPPIFTVIFNATSTFSGGLTVNSQNVQANATNAFGTGPITVALNNSSTSSSQIFLQPGVTIGNSSITIAQGHAVPNNGINNALSAVISDLAGGTAGATGTGDAVVNGTVTIQANNLNGGLFQGPTVGGADFLRINGAVNAAGTADTIVQTGGQVKYSGGGSYPNLLINGTAALGATNGLATNALLQFSVAAPGSPGVAAVASTLDLNGFDQTAVALSATSGLTSAVQNSGTTTNTLTLNTAATTYTYNGTINDNGLANGGKTSLTVGGSGTQQLTNIASTYTGVTTVTGTSVLQAANISNGGTNSSIGASTNAASNLIFDGGTLRYTGATTSTDRGFTINAGKTAKIDVATAGSNLTWTGSSGASTGGLTKLGAGTLTIDASATHGYTGATTVSAGPLIVNNALTNTSSISIAGGATLAGSGSIGGTLTHTAGTINPGAIGGTSAGSFTFTGALALNGGTVQYDVDGSQLGNNAAQDVVNANGGLTIPGASTIDLEFLNPGSPPVSPFDYRLFNYTGTSLVGSGTLNNLNYITNISSRATYTTSATASAVNVHIVPGTPATLTWNSTTGGAWDNTTTNWYNPSPLNAHDKFFNGDSVTFGDNNVPPNNNGPLTTAITIAGAVSPNGWTVNSNTNAYTFSGSGGVGGATSLVMSGTSTLTIKNGNGTPATQNSYSGGTTINAGGTIDVGGSSGNGTLGSGDVSNNGTLRFTRTDGNGITPVTFVNNISGTGDLFNTCPGTTIMSGNINQHSVTLNGNGVTTLSGTVNTTANVTISGATAATLSGIVTTATGFTVNNTAGVTASGGINGAGGVTLNSTGFLTISAGSSYDGSTTINAGTFFPNSNTAFGSTVGSTTVNAGGSIFSVQANTYNGEAIAINGIGNGTSSGALHAGGSGTTVSTFDGPITAQSNSLINVDAGNTLSLTNASALSGTNVTVSLAGTGTVSLSGNVNLGASGALATGTSPVALAPADSSTITISSPITGSGTITSSGSGFPTQTTLGTAILAADSPAYSGTVHIPLGATTTANVQIKTANGAGTGTIAIDGSTLTTNLVASLQLNPTSAGITVPNAITVGARQGNGIDVPHVENISGNNTLTGTITPGTGGSDYNFQSDAGSLTIQSAFNTTGLTSARNLKLQGAGNGTWSGVVSGIPAAPVAVVKNGTGTWTLSGNNTYSGGATVNAGTLVAGHIHALGTTVGPTVNNTAILKLQAGLTAPVQVAGLTIAGGTTPTATLDMTDNNMVVHNGDIGTTIAQLKSGLNASGTLWTGAGITSSTAAANAAANSNSTVFAVGAIKNIDQNNNLIYSTWPAPPSPDTGATGLATTDVLVKYTYFGDANLDGVVDNTTDYDLWSTGFTNPGLAATNGWLYGDFDFSGTVDNTSDYDLWSTGFAHQGGPLTGGGGTAAAPSSVQQVPEPSALILATLGFAGFGLQIIRRRVAAVVKARSSI
jgi:fibronectin-binding autotransporter adhesin